MAPFALGYFKTLNELKAVHVPCMYVVFIACARGASKTLFFRKSILSLQATPSPSLPVAVSFSLLRRYLGGQKSMAVIDAPRS